MKISRAGGNGVVQFTDQARLCGKCGHLFRAFRVFTRIPIKKCPLCGNSGPFRTATEADLADYVARRQPKGWSKVLSAIALTLVAAAFVVRIVRHW